MCSGDCQGVYGLLALIWCVLVTLSRCVLFIDIYLLCSGDTHDVCSLLGLICYVLVTLS